MSFIMNDFDAFLNPSREIALMISLPRSTADVRYRCNESCHNGEANEDPERNVEPNILEGLSGSIRFAVESPGDVRMSFTP